MLKKTFRFLVNIILVLLPFFPVLENFISSVNPDNFPAYLWAYFTIWAAMLLLAFFIRYSNAMEPGYPKLSVAVWLFFTLGMIVMVPLHMGPPRHDETLPAAATEEKFRYVMLFFAAIVFAAGILTAVRPLWAKMNLFEKGILVPLIIAILIAIWDDYDSGMLSTKLAEWIAQGNKAGDFFPNYNFHEGLRATGRIMFYVVASWLSIILYRHLYISRWVFAVLNLYCLAGVVFCALCVLNGSAYYFPFMVPAIALAPAYWLGLAMLNKIIR